MLQEIPLRADDAFVSAPDAPWARIQFAPPDSWVEAEPYDAQLPAREDFHVTHLCWARQVNAGSGRSFHMTAIRLETSLAVQHESQWSVELDARTQRLTLHWLRVVRGAEIINHLHPERMRLLQRETQLERLVLDGRWTLLAVLDDVRPGDVVEAAYTYETQDAIRPGSCEAFFMVPPQAVVGRYHLSVLWPTTEAIGRWLASSDAPELAEETLSDGRRRWSWTGSQIVPREGEPNMPANGMDHVWVQVTDLSDWPALARRVAEVWRGVDDVGGLADVVAFARPERVGEAEVLGLITYFQTEFRYLSLDFQAGGWVPSSPSSVARRRHGDCKDISWLATAVLRSWGVKARPILVGSGFREKVAELLPMAVLFNHAIIEVELEGRARWFDLTERSLGGGFDARAVAWFAHGLPVDHEENDLRAQPGQRAHGLFELRETILLDTRRAGVSLIEQRVRAEGWQADGLRRAREVQGVELFLKEREQFAQRRLGRLNRVGEARWRDDVQANVCEIVEVFEQTEGLQTDESGHRAIYDSPPNLVTMWFALPEDKPRRLPWDMPFPCEVRHIITVKASGLSAAARRNRRWSEPEFELVQTISRATGVWSSSNSLITNAPLVASERVAIYRRQFAEYLREAGWRIYLPAGRPRVRRGYGFGELADIVSAPPVDLSKRAVASMPPLPMSRDAVKLASAEKVQRRTRRGRRRSSSRGVTPWIWGFAIASLAVILVILLRT